MPTSSRQTLADAQAALARQGFSQHIGAELARFSSDETVLTIRLQEHHLQQHGLVHGGVVAYAADNVMAFTAGAELGPSVVSAGLALSFTAPARGTLLVATGTLVTATRWRAVVRCSIVAVDDAGSSTTCAAAHGTFSLLREQMGGPGATR